MMQELPVREDDAIVFTDPVEDNQVVRPAQGPVRE
jgi:hypothetical protein